MKRKNLTSLLFTALIMSAVFAVYSCGSSGSTKKPKGIIIPEGDKATLTVADGFSTIQFPDELDAADRELYDIDFLGYMLRANAPISTSGSEYDGFGIYYYMHDSKEWLYKGIYSNPAEMSVSKIKTIKIANSRKRLREFNTLMPLMDNSAEKKATRVIKMRFCLAATIIFSLRLS